MFSKELEFSIGQCYKQARESRHEFMTVEHLLLALLDNASATTVLKASGATATETSIAENSRMSSTSDNVDDLDEWLTEITKSGGQLMLMQLSKQTIEEIVGPGAAWPDMPPTL